MLELLRYSELPYTLYHRARVRMWDGMVFASPERAERAERLASSVPIGIL